MGRASSAGTSLALLFHPQRSPEHPELPRESWGEHGTPSRSALGSHGGSFYGHGLQLTPAAARR